jgi:hypothetical protein
MSQQPESAATTASNMLNQGVQSISNSLNSAKDQLTQSFNDFSAQPNAPAEFSFSNTIIAKFAFLLLVIILFLFLINLGINLIAYITSPGNNPYLFKGMRRGTDSLIVSQDPNSTGSMTIARSNNQSTGAEFTWSIWLLIEDVPPSGSAYQHIFNKGDATYDANTGLSLVNNAPGLYLGNKNASGSPVNSLRVIMDTVGDLTSSQQTTMASRGTTPSTSNSNTYITPDAAIIDIENVPLKKWFHLAIRLENSILDIYVNGTIDKREILSNVPKQNYYDINICQNRGFAGNLSDFRYFNSALNVFQINTIVSNGPNTNTNAQYSASVQMKDYHYLSNSWYNI